MNISMDRVGVSYSGCSILRPRLLYLVHMQRGEFRRLTCMTKLRVRRWVVINSTLELGSAPRNPMHSPSNMNAMDVYFRSDMLVDIHCISWRDVFLSNTGFLVNETVWVCSFRISTWTFQVTHSFLCWEIYQFRRWHAMRNLF
jgi:hypothetical protein